MDTQAWTYSTKQPVKRVVCDGKQSNNGSLFDEVVVGFKVASRSNKIGNSECGQLHAQCKRKRCKRGKQRTPSTTSSANEDQEEDASFMLFKYENSEHKKRKLKQRKSVHMKTKCRENNNFKKTTRERKEQPSEQLSSDIGEKDLCFMVEVDGKGKYDKKNQMNYAPESIMSKFEADVNKMFKKRQRKNTASDRNSFVNLSMEAPRQKLQDRYHISLSGLDKSPELALKESLHESPVIHLDDDAYKKQDINMSVCQPSLLHNSPADDIEKGGSDFVMISSIYGSPPLTKNNSASKCNSKSLTKEGSVKAKQEGSSLNKHSNVSLNDECHKGRKRSSKDSANYETLTYIEGDLSSKSMLSKNDRNYEAFQYTKYKESLKGTKNDEKMIKAKMSERNKYSVCAGNDRYSECTKRKKSSSDNQVFKGEASNTRVLTSEQTDTQSTAAGDSSSYITCTTSDGHPPDDISRGVTSGSLPTRSTDYTYSFVSTYSEGTSTGGAMSNKGDLDSPHVKMKKFHQLNSTCYRSKENIGDVQFPPSISPILNARERTPKCSTQQTQLAMRPTKPKPKTENRGGSQATRKCSTMLFGSDVEDVNFPSSPGLTTVISGYTSTGGDGNRDPPFIELPRKMLSMKEKTSSVRENAETLSKTLLSKLGSPTPAKPSRVMSQDQRVTLGSLKLNAPTLVTSGVGLPKLKVHKSPEVNLSVKKVAQCSGLYLESYLLDGKEKVKKLSQKKCSSPIEKLVIEETVEVCKQNQKDRQYEQACVNAISERTALKGECEVRPDIVVEHYKKRPGLMKSSTPLNIGKPLTVTLGLSPIPLQGPESEEELCIIPSLDVNSDEIIVPSFISVSDLMDKDRDVPEHDVEQPPANSTKKTTRQIPKVGDKSTSNPGKQLCTIEGQSHEMEMDACDMSGPDYVGGTHDAEVINKTAKQSQSDADINLSPGCNDSEFRNQRNDSGKKIDHTFMSKTTQSLTEQYAELGRGTIVCMINRFIHKLRKRDGLECT